MTPKAEKLLPRIEKAGIKASLKAGHPLGEEELLKVKVQLLPALWRWTLGGFSAAAAYGSYLSFDQSGSAVGWGLATLAVLFFFFAVVGVRRTLAEIVKGLDATSTAELMEAALEGMGAVVGSIFDGV